MHRWDSCRSCAVSWTLQHAAPVSSSPDAPCSGSPLLPHCRPPCETPAYSVLAHRYGPPFPKDGFIKFIKPQNFRADLDHIFLVVDGAFFCCRRTAGTFHFFFLQNRNFICPTVPAPSCLAISPSPKSKSGLVDYGRTVLHIVLRSSSVSFPLRFWVGDRSLWDFPSRKFWKIRFTIFASSVRHPPSITVDAEVAVGDAVLHPLFGYPISHYQKCCGSPPGQRTPGWSASVRRPRPSSGYVLSRTAPQRLNPSNAAPFQKIHRIPGKP